MSYKTSMNDEQGSLAKGLLAGREYAALAADNRANLRRVAQSRNAGDTRAAIELGLIEPRRGGTSGRLLEGFVHGVREFLLDEAKTTQSGSDHG
jgi:hypothetical protein